MANELRNTPVDPTRLGSSPSGNLNVSSIQETTTLYPGRYSTTAIPNFELNDHAASSTTLQLVISARVTKQNFAIDRRIRVHREHSQDVGIKGRVEIGGKEVQSSQLPFSKISDVAGHR